LEQLGVGKAGDFVHWLWLGHFVDHKENLSKQGRFA